MSKRMKNSGFSILEMLVALVILGIALVSILPVFINYASVNRRTEIRAEAVSVAEGVMDGLRQRNFGQWNAFKTTTERDGVKVATGEANDATDDGRTYAVAIDWCDSDLGLTLCDNSGQQQHVRVAVSFGGQQQYSVTTVFTNIQNNVGGNP